MVCFCYILSNFESNTNRGIMNDLPIKNRYGFTLIEFMVAISIFFIISAGSYIPYSHYQKKWLLNQGVKEIVQSLYESRNLSINGLDSWSGNVSIWLYFDTTDGKNTSLTYFTYPHSFTWAQVTHQISEEIHIEKVKSLPQWVQIDSVAWKKKFLVFFSSISWQGSYYYWDPVKNTFTDEEIDIELSYKWAESSSLQRQIKYYTKWNIADY